MKFKTAALLFSIIAIPSHANTYIKGLSVESSDALIVVKNSSVFEKCDPNYPYKRVEDVEYPLGKHPYENNNTKYFLGVSCIFTKTAPKNFTINYAVVRGHEYQASEFYGKKVQKEDIESISSSNEEDYYDYITADGRILPYREWLDAGNLKRDKAIAQLPSSEWKSFRVDAKGTIEKYKSKSPEGKPLGLAIPLGMGVVFPSIVPGLKDRTLHLNIKIDEQGNAEMTEAHRWEHKLPDNPYA